MSIVKGVRDFLIADTTLNAEVAGRVFRHRAPQDESKPFVTLQRIGTTRPYHLGNQAAAAQATVQVDIFVEKPNQVDSLGEHIRDRMSGYRGAMGDETIRGCTCERDTDLTERPDDASDDWNFRRSFDFRITHVETAPTHS